MRSMMRTAQSSACLVLGYLHRRQEKNGNFSFLFARLEKYLGSFDRDTGLVSVSVVSFVSTAAPEHMNDITHIRFSIAATAVDFTTREVPKQFLNGDFLPISREPSGLLTLSVSLPAGITVPVLLLLLKLQYFREVNGNILERFNALCNTCTLL